MISCGGSKKVIETKSDQRIIAKYALKLKSSEASIQNIRLYSFIDDWYGVKYRYGGMSKTGIDCSGFCNILYDVVYDKKIMRTTKELSKVINKVAKNKLKEGDLVFFNVSGKKNSHVGVYLMNDMFVHASSTKGVLISNLNNPYYKKTYNKGGRF